MHVVLPTPLYTNVFAFKVKQRTALFNVYTYLQILYRPCVTVSGKIDGNNLYPLLRYIVYAIDLNVNFFLCLHHYSLVYCKMCVRYRKWKRIYKFWLGAEFKYFKEYKLKMYEYKL